MSDFFFCLTITFASHRMETARVISSRLVCACVCSQKCVRDYRRSFGIFLSLHYSSSSSVVVVENNEVVCYFQMWCNLFVWCFIWWMCVVLRQCHAFARLNVTFEHCVVIVGRGKAPQHRQYNDSQIKWWAGSVCISFSGWFSERKKKEERIYENNMNTLSSYITILSRLSIVAIFMNARYFQ